MTIPSAETMMRLRRAAMADERDGTTGTRSLWPTPRERVLDLRIRLERTQEALREAVAILDGIIAEERDRTRPLATVRIRHDDSGVTNTVNWQRPRD